MSTNETIHPRWAHLEYKWQLDHFWELRALACVEALEDESGGLIWSQKFGDKLKGLWQLKLYPYGDSSPAGKGHVSLFLSLDLKSLEGSKAYAIFGCHFLDEKGEKVQGAGRSFTRQKFAEGSSSWGWSQFIKIDGQNLNRLLCPPNDSLIIRCDIDVFTGVGASPSRNLGTPNLWIEDIKTALSDPRYYDVDVVMGPTVMRANKLALMSRSKYFSDLILKQQQQLQQQQLQQQQLQQQQCSSQGFSKSAEQLSSMQAPTVLGTKELSSADQFIKSSVATNTSSSGTTGIPVAPASSTYYASFGGFNESSMANENEDGPNISPAKATATATGGATGNATGNAKGTAVSGVEALTDEDCSHVNERVVGSPIYTSLRLTVSEQGLSKDILQNIITFLHTDNCPCLDDDTASLTQQLSLFRWAKKFEIDSLYLSLMRKLSGELTSKAAALAIKQIAGEAGAEELEAQCSSFLLTCVRDLTEEELLRAILPRTSSSSSSNSLVMGGSGGSSSGGQQQQQQQPASSS